jgi:hypothetical protein
MSTYTPFVTNITNITNSLQATVTTVETSPYTVGEIVSFRVSTPYGMTQINNLSSTVVEVSSNTFTVDMDTLQFNPFVYPPVGQVVYPALAVPAGSGIVPNSSIPMTNLEDAFDNVPVNS